MCVWGGQNSFMSLRFLKMPQLPDPRSPIILTSSDSVLSNFVVSDLQVPCESFFFFFYFFFIFFFGGGGREGVRGNYFVTGPKM